ncbi:MarR family winged helix-turn-helix transcriptional regulator [Streptomyces sp. NRRL B-24484]|uniref:MarR family winged helix-turn-helix transcriptional regulator n=1 Tax=Streptomyces sp. NRRL B-24484 TaxID=1463833 RepID=UPI0004C01341|nr:MarR family transcriptional regulator [Streptomyces sp. NRRL B-24484]
MMKHVHNSRELSAGADGRFYDPGVRAAMAAFAPDGDTLALEAAAALRSATQAVDRLRALGAGGRGLSTGGLDVLVRLAAADEEGLTVGELARSGGVSSRNVTGLVDTLEGDGLVQRVRDTADRRSVRVVVTDDGRAWLTSFREPTRRAMAAVFRGFTPEDLTAFRHLCLRLVDNQRLLEEHLAGRPAAPPTP